MKKFLFGLAEQVVEALAWAGFFIVLIFLAVLMWIGVVLFWLMSKVMDQ